MKAVKFILGALVLTVSVLAAPAANAQENGNKDENGKVVRGAYLTNQFGDNWFINVGAGLNAFYDFTEVRGDKHVRYGLATNFNFGKWFTPSVGARVGFNGLKNDKGKSHFGYLHADALWNISNAIGGYKETRFWDFVPYFHAGLFIDNDMYGVSGEDFAMGFGLMNVLRLSNRVDLTLDIRGNIYENGYNNPAGYISTALGLSFNLGKTNFVRASNWHNPKDVAALDAAAASAAALTAANAALEAEKKALQNANADLTSKNNDLQRALAEAQANMGLTEVGPAVFYFEIGKAVLSQKELEHLDFYIKNVLPNVKGKTLTVITGTADKKTGTTKRNNLLCEQRAEYIKNLMAEQYGIDVSGFETRTVLPTDGDASLNRAVIISFE